jgi:hypothetical protein
MNDAAPITPITATKIKTGWRYQQGDVVVRTSKKGGPAYAFAVTINGYPVNFNGSRKSATSEKTKHDKYTAYCRAEAAKHQTVERYVAAYLASKNHAENLAWYLKTEGEAAATAYEASMRGHRSSGWQIIVADAQRVCVIVPITTVDG